VNVVVFCHECYRIISIFEDSKYVVNISFEQDWERLYLHNITLHPTHLLTKNKTAHTHQILTALLIYLTPPLLSDTLHKHNSSPSLLHTAHHSIHITQIQLYPLPYPLASNDIFVTHQNLILHPLTNSCNPLLTHIIQTLLHTYHLLKLPSFNIHLPHHPNINHNPILIQLTYYHNTPHYNPLQSLSHPIKYNINNGCHITPIKTTSLTTLSIILPNHNTQIALYIIHKQ